MITEKEPVDLSKQGLARRIMASTSMNAASSRPYVLITLTVQRQMPDGSVTRSKLAFVNLGGTIQSSKAKGWEQHADDIAPMVR